MLRTRSILPEDLPEIQRLHDKYFGDKFTLPDLTKMLCGFVIVNSNDKIIMAGGIRRIGETILVTNKDHTSKIELGRALVEAQNISQYVCQQDGIEWLHAFVKDAEYASHLIRHGFNPRCQALSMKV